MAMRKKEYDIEICMGMTKILLMILYSMVGH